MEWGRNQWPQIFAVYLLQSIFWTVEKMRTIQIMKWSISAKIVYANCFALISENFLNWLQRCRWTIPILDSTAVHIFYCKNRSINVIRLMKKNKTNNCRFSLESGTILIFSMHLLLQWQNQTTLGSTYCYHYMCKTPARWTIQYQDPVSSILHKQATSYFSALDYFLMKTSYIRTSKRLLDFQI